MSFTWSAALETGHPVIDAQHWELINAVNNLLEACQHEQAEGNIDKALNFLVLYAKKHFADEEMQQQQSNFPDFLNHRNLHNSFMMLLMDLVDELRHFGPSPMLVNRIVRNSGDWLITHIQKEDARVAAHLRKSGAA